MSTILIVVVLLLLFGGGGGYYAHGRYGGAGLGGVLGTGTDCFSCIVVDRCAARFMMLKRIWPRHHLGKCLHND